jgi:hypothetical protein
MTRRRYSCTSTQDSKVSACATGFVRKPGTIGSTADSCVPEDWAGCDALLSALVTGSQVCVKPTDFAAPRCEIPGPAALGADGRVIVSAMPWPWPRGRPGVGRDRRDRREPSRAGG